jgi:AcrR family transcriptional regulator
VQAARRVFERDGYVEPGIEDIVKEAGVARGSFYTYFPAKFDVFKVVVDQVVEEIDSAVGAGDRSEQLDTVDALCRSNLRYIEAYRKNAKIYALTEQIEHIDPGMERARRARRRRDIERIANAIRRWQSRGVADPSVNPIPTAAALLSMTRHLCYWMYVGGDSGYGKEEAADALNDIWIRAVDLRRSPNRRWLAASVD